MHSPSSECISASPSGPTKKNFNAVDAQTVEPSSNHPSMCVLSLITTEPSTKKMGRRTSPAILLRLPNYLALLSFSGEFCSGVEGSLCFFGGIEKGKLLPPG